MSNAEYYRYEAALLDIIREADPLTVRGALVGAMHWIDDADQIRKLHTMLWSNAMPDTEFREKLSKLQEKRAAP